MPFIAHNMALGMPLTVRHISVLFHIENKEIFAIFYVLCHESFNFHFAQHQINEEHHYNAIIFRKCVFLYQHPTGDQEPGCTATCVKLEMS